MRLFALGALVVLGACVKAEPQLVRGAEPHELVGRQRFDFSLKRYPEGTSFELSSARGKVVLVDVWATWCLPCRDSLPLYSDLQRQYGERVCHPNRTKRASGSSDPPGQPCTEAGIRFPHGDRG